jgi:hypothetical protein
MGGFNSGRKAGKSTTEGRNTLDVRKCQRDGVLIPGTRFDSSWTRNGQPSGSISVMVNTDSVNLVYRHGGDTGQDMNYSVQIVWTPCNYGGRRVWWHCPCCGRRVAVLYADRVFSCRHCLDLTYETTRTATDSKPYERGDRIRRRLGWCTGVGNGQGDKPKGMHEKTFGRHLQTLDVHTVAAARSLDKLLKRVTNVEGLYGV